MLDSLTKDQYVGVVEAMHPIYNAPTLLTEEVDSSLSFNDAVNSVFRHDYFYDVDKEFRTDTG